MSNFFRSLAAIFTPPFNGLALVAVLFYIWAHLVFPHNDIMRGNLPDPDDYMYLAQVLDWVQGQGWYDNVQHRMDAPAGVPIHFSRFAQMPMAGGIVVLHALGLPLRGAATLVALIEPLVLMGLLFVVLRRLSAFVVPARWAGASAYITLFSLALLFEFMPGHVDHHGLVIVLTLTAVGCLLRLLDAPHDTKAALAAGFLLALTLTIALEVLPWVLLLSAFMGVWSLYHGGKASRSAAIYAVSLLIGAAGFLALTRPPALFLDSDVLTYSFVYVLLTAAIAVPFIGVWLADRLLPAVRGIVGLTLSGLAAGLFLHAFPEMVTGPYGSIDPQLLPLLLNVVQEALPMWKTPDAFTHMLEFLTMGVIGLGAAVVYVWRGQGVEREKWLLFTVLLAAALGMAVFYQYRFIGMASAVAVVPLTALLYRGWHWIGRRLDGRRKVFAEIGLLLAVAPLSAVILPALFDGRSFNTGVMLFPVDAGRAVCDMAKLEGVLRDPQGLGAKPLTIASIMDIGPELLFRTDHHVLAAPFHMNVQGNLDAARFLSTPYPSEALNIAKRRGIDLVVACNAIPGYLIPAKDAPPPFLDQIFRGVAPDWLERVPLKGINNFIVYRVVPEKMVMNPPKTPHGQKK